MPNTPEDAPAIATDLISMAISHIIYKKSVLPKDCFNDRVYVTESGREVALKEIKKGAHVEGDRLLSFIEDWISKALDWLSLSSVTLIFFGQTSAGEKIDQSFSIKMGATFSSVKLDSEIEELKDEDISPTEFDTDPFYWIDSLISSAERSDTFSSIRSFEVRLGNDHEPDEVPWNMGASPPPCRCREKFCYCLMPNEIFSGNHDRAANLPCDKWVPVQKIRHAESYFKSVSTWGSDDWLDSLATRINYNPSSSSFPNVTGDSRHAGISFRYSCFKEDPSDEEDLEYSEEEDSEEEE